jgi:hypothetical protein
MFRTTRAQALEGESQGRGEERGKHKGEKELSVCAKMLRLSRPWPRHCKTKWWRGVGDLDPHIIGEDFLHLYIPLPGRINKFLNIVH